MENNVEVLSCDGLPSQDYIGRRGTISAIKSGKEYEISVSIKGHSNDACFKRNELRVLSNETK